MVGGTFAARRFRIHGVGKTEVRTIRMVAFS